MSAQVEPHWHEEKALIQLGDNMLANKISLKMFLKLPLIQKCIESKKVGEVSVEMWSEAIFEAPLKLDSSAAIRATTWCYCCETAQTIPPKARENGATNSSAASRHLLAIRRKTHSGSLRSSEISIFWGQDFLR